MVYILGTEKAFETEKIGGNSVERKKQEPWHQDVRANGILGESV